METTNPTPPGGAKRLRLTERERIEHLSAWTRSGRSARDYAAEHGLRAANLYTWSAKKRSSQLERNPMDGSLFVFANRRRDRVKLLYWDGPGEAVSGGLEIKPEALSMLLNGIDLKAGSLRAWFCR